jgi:hypothetical protein
MLERLADAYRIAARQREARSRRRRKAGLLILPVEVNEIALVESLLAAGRICEADAGNRERVKAAAQDVLADFINRWRTK